LYELAWDDDEDYPIDPEDDDDDEDDLEDIEWMDPLVSIPPVRIK
jgi:hypothetical protein